MFTGIQHAALLCEDLDKARAFYEGVLGLPRSAKRPPMKVSGVWYELPNDQQIHLMCIPNPEIGLERPQHGGRDRHIALGVQDVEQVKHLLAQAGIEYTVSQSGRSAVFCRDPDGNALEFIEVSK